MPKPKTNLLMSDFTTVPEKTLKRLKNLATQIEVTETAARIYGIGVADMISLESNKKELLSIIKQL